MKRITLTLLFALALTSLSAVAAFSQAKEITAKEFKDANEKAQAMASAYFPRRETMDMGTIRVISEYLRRGTSRITQFEGIDSKAPSREDLFIDGNSYERIAGGKWTCGARGVGYGFGSGSDFPPTYYVRSKVLSGDTYLEYVEIYKDIPGQADPETLNPSQSFLVDPKGRLFRSTVAGEKEFEYDAKIDPIVAPKGVTCKK